MEVTKWQGNQQRCDVTPNQWEASQEASVHGQREQLSPLLTQALHSFHAYLPAASTFSAKVALPSHYCIQPGMEMAGVIEEENLPVKL